MPILKNNQQKKHVGALLPSWVSNYLALYTMAKGLTKTDILKPLIENWVTNNKTRDSEPKLVTEIITRINMQYKTDSSVKDLDLETFKTYIQKELFQAGFREKDIQTIVKGINNGKN